MQRRKIFISYTHDSPEHDTRVLKLSNKLREEAGFDSDIDQYHANQSWPIWMEDRIDWADKVIVVCTETYLQRWKRNEKPGVGLGAKWESFLIRQDLYELPALNEKFIPVIFNSADVPYIPMPLRDVTRVVIGVELEGFERLRNRILGIPPAEKAPINMSLAPIPCAEGFFGSSRNGNDQAGLKPDALGLHEEPEKLFTNLFQVEYPDRIYQAKAKIKNVGTFLKEFYKEWKDLGNMPPAPTSFWSERGMIYSFYNFEAPIWRGLEKARKIFPKGFVATNTWAQSKSSADKSRFIKLLNRSLNYLCEDNGTPYQITWSIGMKCYLFTKKGDMREGKLSTTAIKSQAPRTVFKAIQDKTSNDLDAIQHWKHVAFRHHFVRFGATWYLVLKPFWAFTSDGCYTPSRWQKKSSFNMQKPEKNRAVLGHVMFWASVLCREHDLVETDRKFRLLRPSIMEVTPSVHDADWVRIADEKDKAEFKHEEGLLL